MMFDVILKTREDAEIKHNGSVGFECSQCKQVKPVHKQGSTGYAYQGNAKGPRALICYECCGLRDKETMIADGKTMLYWIGDYVVNWCETLKFKVNHTRTGKHNIARRRYDIWFTGPDGKPWHGIQYGDNTQICHCKRVKG
jgi:hypothetical protein